MALQWACSQFTSVEAVLASDCGCPMESTDDITGWIDAASDVLYHLSDGYITGVCTQTVRPVTNHESCLPLSIGPWMAGCCDDGPRLMLRGPNPVVHQVKINGEILDPSEYALVADGGFRLIRRNGSWPTRNDIRLDDTEEGTWSVSLSFGGVMDYITEQAAIEMTCELAKYAGIGSTEVFAPGVVSANVQGATVGLEDVAQAVMNGQELMPKVSRFLSMYGGIGSSAHVFSPEIEGYRLVKVTYYS